MKNKVIFVLSALLAIIIVLTLSESYRYYYSFRTVPLLDEMIFAKELKNKVNLENDIVISVGPYHAFRSFLLGDNYTSIKIDTDLANSAYLFYSAGVYYLMFDYEFYKKLSEEERRLVIAHEFWHAYRFENDEVRGYYLSTSEAVQEEIRADNFALGYVKPPIMLQFLNIYCNETEEKEARINNVRKLAGS